MVRVSAAAARFEDWDGVHDAVANAYFPHMMRPLSAGSASLSALEVIDLGPCRVTNMALGATVSVRTDHPGAYAINIPMSGRLESEIAGIRVESVVGEATVCPPDTPTLLPSWAPSCRLMGFRLEQDFLEREFERVLARRPQRLPDKLNLSSDDGRDWLALLTSTVDQVRNSSSRWSKDPRLTVQVSSMLVTGLLLAITPDERNERSGTRPRIVRRVIQAIEDDPAYRWTPSELAEHAGVSVRRLQQGFREYVGQTPFQYLHDVRLEQAHQDLLKGSQGATVTDIAMRWGLTHTGRFAADYRRRYGRSPSETLNC